MPSLIHKVQSATRVSLSNPRGQLLKVERKENPEPWTAKKSHYCEATYASQYSQPRVPAHAHTRKPERSVASVACKEFSPV
jgi:hypothetical protein